MTAGTPPRPRAPSGTTMSTDDRRGMRAAGSATSAATPSGESLSYRLLGGAILVITVLAILFAACAAVALASSTGTLSAPAR